ncbi:MAG TPA: hypothetical protein VK059_10710 [Nocardioidaceae bacterium]|nr:hypothetical protein [Nocardioidaceae bacterium]
MRLNAQLIIGIALLVAAAVLLIGFREDEFFWFRGQPLGVVLAILGGLDLLEYASKRGRTRA